MTKLLTILIWLMTPIMVAVSHSNTVLIVPVSGSTGVITSEVVGIQVASYQMSDRLVFDNCGILKPHAFDLNDAREVKEVLAATNTSCYNKWVTRWIIHIESTSNCKAKNPSSSAYGCAQFLTSTWNRGCVPLGFTNRTSINDQVRCVVKFVERGALQTDWMPYWQEHHKTKFYNLLSNSI
jgi:hypothetical protein